MQHPILKLTALVGVVGIGFLVVYQAQKGMSRPSNQVDTHQALVELGSPTDELSDAPPTLGESQPASDPSTANADDKFPFGNEPAVGQPSNSGISFLEQTEPKVAETAPAGDSHHDHDGADPHSEIATDPKDSNAAKPFDPFGADSTAKSKSAQPPDGADTKSSENDSDKGVQQVGHDEPASGAPPTLVATSEPAPIDTRAASSPGGGGGPQLFAPNPEPSSSTSSEPEHGPPDAFPFDAKNAPRPISQHDEPAPIPPADGEKDTAEKLDDGPLAPSKDPLNDPTADPAAKDSKDHDPIGDVPETKIDPIPVANDEPKAPESVGDSIPVDLGAPKDKVDTAPALDRQSPNLDVPDPTLSDPFGSVGKSGPDQNKKPDAEPAVTEPAKIDADSPPDPSPAAFGTDDQPAAKDKDLNERPKSNETIPIPQRHENSSDDVPATDSSESSQPPLVHGDGGTDEELPKITPRFPKRGGDSTKPMPQATHENESDPAPRPADVMNGDGTIRDDAPQGPQQPRLKLEKSAPANAIIGQPMVYSIFVENVGNSPAHKVVVQDRIPRGSKLSGTIPRAELIQRQLTWKLGTLDPGEKQKISVRVTPTDAGTLGSVATVSFEAQVAARTVITSPKVSVDAIGPQRAKIGEPVTFHFKVTNEGSGTAQKVVLRNILPTGLAHAAGKELEYDVGTLPPGATRDIELTLTAAESGEMVNRTVVTTADGFSAEAKSKVDVEELGLLITREGPARRIVGRPGAFINTVTNRSSQPIYAVQIVELVPDGMEFIEASDGGKCDATQRKVVWQIEKLNPGEDRKVQIKLMPREAGELASSVMAIDRNGNKVETTARTAVTGFAAVTLELPALPGPVEVGETVTLRIEAGNKGTSAATNVRLQASVSEEMELVSIKGATGHERNGNAMRFAAIPSLGERTPAVFEIVLKARRSGDARVAVQIEADQLSKPVHREEAILILPSGQ